VDSPETDNRYPDRLREQGDYFGGLSEKDVLKLGKEATRFTDDFLSGTFTVHTRYDDARGASRLKRYYGIIEKEGVSLAEALVERGLARIYGVDVTPPGAATAKAYLLRLKGLENEAKKAGRGGWETSARAKAAAARGAFPAAWQVAEHDTVTRVSTVLLAAEPPHRVTGTLPVGQAVRVLSAATFPGKVKVQFTGPDGAVREALVDRAALAAPPAAPAP
jgi:endonuclease YncB( thermonuclease family)